MRNGFTAGIVFFALLFQASCETKTNESMQPQISVTRISVSEVPSTFDNTRTYYYPLSNPNPKSLLLGMFQQGIPVSEAWLPLDNRCANPIGPHFTVELKSADPRILNFGFVQGADQLFCSTKLDRYTITD